jgi:hypothetical protein
MIALAVRVLTAVTIAIGWGGSLFLDDASYSRMAAAAADGRLTTLGSYVEWLYGRTATLLVPITGLYEAFGPVTLAGQLYVAVFGAVAAAATTRLALEMTEWPFAVLAGAVVALLPSQILWSSIVMKDALVWALMSGLALVLALAARSCGRRLAAYAIGSLALICLLGWLRLPTLEIACVAAVLAMLFSVRNQRVVRVTGAVIALVCVPLAFHMGPAGWDYVNKTRDPALQRALNAENGESRVVSRGGVDRDAVVRDAEVDTQISYLPKGAVVVALRPWPWEPARGRLGIALARIESMLWYPLLGLAVVGLTTAWRRRLALAFPLLAGGATLVAYALTEGNLGTAFRHRGELVWVVALLAALGTERLAGGWPLRHAPRAPT